jgi:hypothetical protein
MIGFARIRGALLALLALGLLTGAAAENKSMECICSGKWFYSICLDPNLSEDVGSQMKTIGGKQIQFRGRIGFRSAKSDPDGKPCTIEKP